MGNCQAVDTASLVIQYPAGKSEKLFWPVPASQVMKTNPGHCVALLITTTTTTVPGAGVDSNKSTVRVTRVKLLRPTDTLTLGHVYRLISIEEVTKGLVAKKHAKMMKMKQADDMQKKPLEKGLEAGGDETKQDMVGAGRRSSSSSAAATATVFGLASAQPEKSNQMSKHEMQKQRSSLSSSALKPKAWQPSLKSISESHS